MLCSPDPWAKALPAVVAAEAGAAGGDLRCRGGVGAGRGEVGGSLCRECHDQTPATVSELFLFAAVVRSRTARTRRLRRRYPTRMAMGSPSTRRGGPPRPRLPLLRGR